MKGISGSVAVRVGVIGVFAALLIVGLAGLMQANAGVSPQYNLTASIKASTTSGSSPLTVSFSATLSGGGTKDAYTYAWNFGDGSTSTTASPQHVFSTPKTYTVSLTVTDTTAKQTVSAPSINIQVNGGISATISQPVNQGNGVYKFSATATGGTGAYTYTWDFGDQTTATGQTVTHTYTQAGTYTVTLTVQDSNGARSAPQTTQVTVSSAGTSAGATSSPANYTWVYIVVLVVVAVILGVLIYRKFHHRSPPQSEQQNPYDAGGYAPYAYGTDVAATAAVGSAVSGSPSDSGAYETPPPPEAGAPTGGEPMPPSTPEAAPATEPMASPEPPTPDSSSSSSPASDKACFVCGGPLSGSNYCSRCQMDWGGQSAGGSPNPA